MKKTIIYSIHKIFFLFIILYISLLTLFISKSIKASEVIDKIVAIVNDDIITLTDLNKEYSLYRKQIEIKKYPKKKKERILKKVRNSLLDTLIDQKLSDQVSKKLNLDVKEAEIDNKIKTILKQNKWDKQTLIKNLAKQGMTLFDYRENVKKQILIPRIINRQIKSKVVVTKEEINSYFEKNKKEYASSETKYSIKHILMKSSFSESKEVILNKIKMVHDNLKKGESFEMLSREYSQSPFASNGGKLGYFNINKLSPVIKKAVENLKTGEFSDVIDTPQGYQIFLVGDIKEIFDKSKEEIENEIKKKIYDEKVDTRYMNWIKTLRSDAHIKVVK